MLKRLPVKSLTQLIVLVQKQSQQIYEYYLYISSGFEYQLYFGNSIQKHVVTLVTFYFLEKKKRKTKKKKKSKQKGKRK